MVADGMGDPAGGSQASALAVESGLRYLRNTVPWFLGLAAEQVEEAEETLRAVVSRCHQTVLAAALQDPEHRRLMGTTLTMAHIIWPYLFVVYAGDSRCYLLRDRQLTQLTRDHTVAQELVERQILDPERACVSRNAEVLSRMLGGGDDSHLTPDVVRLRLRDSDQLLLCSDGLTNMLSDGRICRLMLRESFAKPRCQRLIEAANEAGGTDNITVVTASFEHDRR
jgi:protein phosphatase